MRRLELPPLVEADIDSFEIYLTEDQYMASCDRLVEQQQVRVKPGDLWSKLLAVPTHDYQSRQYPDLPRTIGDVYPPTGIREELGGPVAYAIGLYAVLRTVHDLTAESIRHRANRGVQVERGDYGLAIGSMRYIKLPQNMSKTGLVTATCAMNDHISRGRGLFRPLHILKPEAWHGYS